MGHCFPYSSKITLSANSTPKHAYLSQVYSGCFHATLQWTESKGCAPVLWYLLLSSSWAKLPLRGSLRLMWESS